MWAPLDSGDVSEDNGNETGRVLMWIGIGLLVILLLGLPFGWLGGGYDGWDFFAGMFAMIFMFPVLLIIVVIVLVVTLTNNSKRKTVETNPGTPASTAKNDATLAIVERRYASGELSRAEYLRMKRDLNE